MISVKDTNLPWDKYSGKVRDVYDINGSEMLIISTDRISAFDVVFNEIIPGKGILLNQLSNFWFSKTTNIVKNHIIRNQTIPNNFPNNLLNRTMFVKKTERINLECIVRGHIAGQAWDEYNSYGTINKKPIKENLYKAQKFKYPIFTPSTKSETGHDVPLSDSEAIEVVGNQTFTKLREISLEIFSFAYKYMKSKQMILADTKFEFGLYNGELILIDEILTPDSSRFWEENDIKKDQFPPAYDKQFLRQWLIDLGWNKEPPPPALPNNIIRKTLERYLRAYERITENSLDLKEIS